MSPGRVVSLRREIGGSPADMARLVGVDTRTWTRWEQGTAKPSGAAAKLLLLFESTVMANPEGVAWLRSAMVRGGLPWLVERALGN